MVDEEKTKEQLIRELQSVRKQLEDLQSEPQVSKGQALTDDEHERKDRLTEEAFRESEATLRSLYNSASMMMGVVELIDNDVLHISVNQATAKFFGTTQEAMIGKLASQLGATEELSRTWIAAYKESARTGEPLRFEYKLKGKKGERLLASTVSHIGEIAEGHNRFCYIIEDITERKRIEEAVRESQERYRHLVNNAGDIIYKADAKGYITLFNPTATRILGYAEEELLGRHYLDVVHPDYRKAGERFYGRQLVKRVTETYLEFPALTKDGSVVWLEQNVRLVLQDNEVIGFEAIARDITKRKAAEEATQRAESQVRTLVENARDVIARFDRNRRYLYVNPAVERFTQRRPESFIGKPFGESGVPAAQLALWNEAHQKVCETGKETEIEFILPKPDGNIYRQSYMVPEFAADGAVESVLVVTRDISKRKRAEERLRESEARHRALLNAIPDIIFRVTKDGTIVDYKANQKPQLLTPPRDFLGKKIAEVFPPAVAEKRMQHIQQAMENDGIVLSEFQFVIGETVKEYEARTVASGKDEVVTILRDVTERKREERALKASEERFSRIFQASPLPMNIRYLEDGRFVDANEAYQQAVGRTLEELQGRTPVELGTWVNPADYEHFMSLVRQGKTVRNYECQLQIKNGRKVVVMLTAETIEVNGRQCVLVITVDITQRKQAEAEREQLIAQLQEALAKVKLLSGFLPICASCKKIRDDQGYWNQIEEYISKHSEAEFSHSVCPDCMENLYGDLLRKRQAKAE